ncbi:hypothetical protein [Bizionia arctica]|uniref:hypothetical protein n=1 Tax=Bizionia arctica TaxID=1495645 RepID=UPI0016630749|nr:hypothetical protein [Bizionia arctica]
MEELKPHETSEKSKKIIRIVLIGISTLTIISAISMPWDVWTSKETVIAMLSLLFINGFLLWTYHILFVWKQKILEYLERKHKVTIVTNTSGSFNIEGEVSLITKLFIHIQILFYYILGMVGPLALFISALIWYR